MSGLLLGVDGGNSKTLAVLATCDGRLLGVGRSGGSNRQGVGLPVALERIRAAIAGAFVQAGIEPQRVTAASFALAGADFPEDFAMLEPALADLNVAERWELNNDSIAALWSGSSEPNAVVVLWGAGTNAAGRNPSGGEVRLPALGTISGDWGGGGDLGNRAVWLVARANDGRGEPTLLTDMVLEALRVPNADEMIRALYFDRSRRQEVVSLAPLIFQAANRGDGPARKVVQDAAEEIAVTARALLRRLDLLEAPADVVLAGSVFKAEGTMFLDEIRARLERYAPLARIVRPDVEPVIGCLFGAFAMMGTYVDEAMRTRMRQEYAALTTAPREGVTL